MSKSKIYGAVTALVLVVLAAGWYFGSPWWTLRQMQTAAVEKDSEKLSGYIDYPSLRSSLKEQMKAKMAAEMVKVKDDNPFGALGAALAMNLVDGMIDAMVTPSALREVFANAPAPKPEDGKIGVRVENLELERSGLSEFSLVNREDKTGASIIFKRDGLGWKMTEIRVPDEA